MFSTQLHRRGVPAALLLTAALLFVAAPLTQAQNFMVQCPTTTLLHPTAVSSTPGEPTYTGPTTITASAYGVPLTYTSNGGAIKCQQISGGDGYMTEADGNQTFMFAFGPLSGLDKIKNGHAGTDFPDEFNQPYCDPNNPNYNNGQANPWANGMPNPIYPNAPAVSCNPNGAVGYVPSAAYRTASATTALAPGNTATSATPTAVSGVLITDPGAGYAGAPTVTIAPPAGCTINGTTCRRATATATIGTGSVIEVAITNPGNGYTSAPVVSFTPNGTSAVSGTDAAAIMNTGVMNGNIPAPLMAFDEDDEFFLTLTNVGMIMRPDLFEQHTVHFHGYPNASSYYDGVPDPPPRILVSAPPPLANTNPHTTGYKYIYNDGDGSTRYDIDVPIQIHGFDPTFHFVGMTFNPEGFSDMKDKYFLLNGRSYPDTVGVAGGPADVLGQLKTATNPDPVTHAISTTDTDTLSRPSQPLPALITLNSKGGPSGVC